MNSSREIIRMYQSVLINNQFMGGYKGEMYVSLGQEAGHSDRVRNFMTNVKSISIVYSELVANK